MGQEGGKGRSTMRSLTRGGAALRAVANRLARRRARDRHAAPRPHADNGDPPAGEGRGDGSPDPDRSALETADKYFLDSLSWLGATYRDTTFWTERDIVYVLQRHLTDVFRRTDAGWRVFNGHRVNPDESPPMSADLVIVSPKGQIHLGAEFKYEPCHRRHDIAKGKFPVAVWTDIVKDTARARLMVERGAEVAYAIFVDEGAWSSKRDRSIFEEQLLWDTTCPCRSDHGVDVLIYRASGDQ
jgi:hypothetical protein